MKRDFLCVTDFSSDEIRANLQLAIEVKAKTKEGKCPDVLRGGVGALIFHKASLRTRCSFEVGFRQLGGSAIYITDKEIELGKRESIHDVAKVMSRYFAVICIRTFSHPGVVELAKHADVPVVNMLTDLLHPCQVMGDMQTILEHRKTIDNLSIAYLGDGNNLTNTWMRMAQRIPMDLRIGTSPDTLPDMTILEETRKCGLSQVTVHHDAVAAVKGADVIYTDVWASMGQKDKAEEKAKALQAFQINAKLLAHAKKDALVMHCLPAERGREITDDMMDGPNSVVFDEAENRLHAQKAVLIKLLGK
ncbi:MAG: ornithine carbamoyltransferase [Proteobacteria bacterium]|jgi:ornithine carbamoyltransferase|nr:ornithine carbamoyltransferase [Pseudomonadota bacterium]